MKANDEHLFDAVALVDKAVDFEHPDSFFPLILFDHFCYLCEQLFKLLSIDLLGVEYLIQQGIGCRKILLFLRRLFGRRRFIILGGWSIFAGLVALDDVCVWFHIDQDVHGVLHVVVLFLKDFLDSFGVMLL